MVLGVAMISGTFILTDTIDKAFSDVFQTASQGVDVSVTGAQAGRLRQRPTSSRSTSRCCRRSRPWTASASPRPACSSRSSIRNKKGDSIGAGGAPNFISSNSNPPFNAFRYVQGRPAADGRPRPRWTEKTADDEGFKVGDKVTVVGLPGAKTYTVSGVAKFAAQAIQSKVYSRIVRAVSG